MLELYLRPVAGDDASLGPFHKGAGQILSFKTAVENEVKALDKHGIDGFLRSEFLHRAMSHFNSSCSQIMFKPAETQRIFQNEGIQGQGVTDPPLLVAGRPWAI